VENLSSDWLELQQQQQQRVDAAATADAFMNYISVDRSRMVSHIIPVSGVSKSTTVLFKSMKSKGKGV